LLLVVLTANAQIKTEQLNLMPWPQNINLTDVTLTKKFKVNITGNPNDRLFKGVSKFLHRLDGRTGLF
jgi:hexosaminidase